MSGRSIGSRLTAALAAVLTVASFGVPIANAAGPTGPAKVDVGVRALGNILVDQNGWTLYAFLSDNHGPSVCYGRCESFWPPLLTKDAPLAGTGVIQGLIGALPRTDGTIQVTYNGWPLYYFARDTAPGDMRGQWVLNTWFTLNSDGTFNAKRIPYIGMASSPVGNTLVGPNGKTLYILTKDTPGVSNCYGQCATFWPPLIADATPQANKGVTGSLFGTTKRTDGTMQATFNGMPLYYFLEDKAAGEWNGQGIGKVWWMVNPTGTPIATNLPPFATLASGATPYGPILTGKNGMTVYILTRDAKGQSVCYNQCAAVWPPVLSDIPVITGSGINAKLIGTTKRTDGTNQVTFNGMPLYYYAGDKAPGDLNGQNVFSVWFVLRPSGKVLMPGDQSLP